MAKLPGGPATPVRFTTVPSNDSVRAGGLEAGGLAERERVEDALGDRGRDEGVAAVEHAQQVLAAADLLAGRGEDFPDAPGRQGHLDGGAVRS